VVTTCNGPWVCTKKVHCGDGEFVIINKYDDEVRIKYNNDGYVINGYRFKSLNRPLAAVFLGEEYWGVDARNKIIIDIGAFVGDSAIYFVLKGARRVIAIEPHPGAFAEMLDNIKLNNLEGVIIPVNAGLVGRPGKICIEDVGVEDTAVTYHRPGDCPSTIKAVTLGELINGFGIDGDRAVLKMDCEGCEFDVILNDYEHVRLFRELIFEYHSYVVNKPVDDILRVLDRDYKCEVRGDKNGGIIQCIRK